MNFTRREENAKVKFQILRSRNMLIEVSGNFPCAFRLMLTVL